MVYWQRAASYGQTRVFEILQYVASQSTPRPRPAQVCVVDTGIIWSSASFCSMKIFLVHNMHGFPCSLLVVSCVF